MKKYKALKNHICGNNDGECVCKCFNKGYKKAVKDIKKIIDDIDTDFGFLAPDNQ